MKTDIHDRLDLLIKALDISKNAFAKQCQIASTQIYNIISKRNAPSHDLYVRIAIGFPNVNLAWLIAERGSMLNDTQVAAVKENESIELMERIKVMEEQLKLIGSYIKEKDATLELGDRIMTMLDKKIAKSQKLGGHKMLDNGKPMKRFSKKAS